MTMININVITICCNYVVMYYDITYSQIRERDLCTDLVIGESKVSPTVRVTVWSVKKPELSTTRMY